MNVRKVIRLASTPVTMLVLLSLLAIGVFWGYKAVTAKVPGPLPPACVTVSMPELTTSAVTVNVYNAGTKAGLAKRISGALSGGGFVVDKVANTEQVVQTILIIGAAEDNPEVQLVAAWFANPVIHADGRPDHSVDVVVGSDFNEQEGMVAEPPASLQLPSGEVCLPAPTPTPAPTEDPTDPVDPTDTVDPSGEPT